jgi:hypothetical protein
VKKLIFVTALAFTLVGIRPASAQDPVDEDIKLFRKDLRSVRKQIIAANMVLSDKEAEHSGRCSNGIPRSLSRNRTRNTHCLRSMRKITRQ